MKQKTPYTKLQAEQSVLFGFAIFLTLNLQNSFQLLPKMELFFLSLQVY